MSSSDRPGPPPPWRPPGDDTRPPATSLSDALDSYLRSEGHDDARTLGSVVACWEEVVGHEVSGHARPRSLRDGVLVVAVDHPAWATQFAFLSEAVLDSLERRLGRRVATAVEVTTRRRPDVE
ncbi:MAG: DUF721 domain-containing protein [Actinomycetota bacterium]|nr:DUF721 domain-containing protein [Actinomycetota bacterium]